MDIDSKKLKEYRELVSSLVSSPRFEHSLAVERQAISLAKHHNISPVSVSAAAILHDIAKEMNPNDQLALIMESDISFDISDMQSPKLWHSVAGAAYAKNKLKINNDDIINAIRYHTSGRPEMSLMEKVVFIADITSEDRNYPEAENLRNIVKTSLDLAVYEYSKINIIRLARKKLHISRNTMGTYSYYLKLVKQSTVVMASAGVAI